VLPTNRLAKHHRHFAGAAQHALLSRPTSEIRRAGQACGGHRIGRHHQVVVGDARDFGVLLKKHLPCSSVDLLHRTLEPDIHPQLAIDAVELDGELPETAAHEPVVTPEYGARVHHRDDERRIGLRQRYRPAFGDRHRHVHARAFRREVMLQEIAGTTGDPAACQLRSQRCLGIGDRGRTCIPVAPLQEVDDFCLVGAERDGITPLAELRFELAVEALGLAPDPYRLVVTGKIDQLGVRWRKGLEARSEPGLVEHEVLHQAQHRGAVGVVLPYAIDLRGGRHTGTADSRGALDHRDPAAGPRQIVCCHQAIDAGTHDDDVHFVHTRSFQRMPVANVA
jgi:hypothetical protein